MSIEMKPCWDLANLILDTNGNLLFYGPPGTGKTRQATQFGINDPDDVITITLTEETPAAELKGHFIVKDRDFIWHDGLVVQAWKLGKRLVINEIDHASGDVFTILMAALDDPQVASLTLPITDEFGQPMTVRPQPGYHAIATMNGVPDDLPEALRDRFPAKVNINEAHPDAIASLPTDLQEPARNSVGVEDGRVSVRSWFSFAALREQIRDEEAAAQLVFGTQYQEVLNAMRIAEERDAEAEAHAEEERLEAERIAEEERLEEERLEEMRLEEEREAEEEARLEKEAERERAEEARLEREYELEEERKAIEREREEERARLEAESDPY